MRVRGEGGNIQVAVVGPGAVGLYFLYRLAPAGIAAPETGNEPAPWLITKNSIQARFFAKNGFRIIEGNTEIEVAPAQFRAVAKTSGLNFIFLAVKRYDLNVAMRRIRKMLAPNGVIVSLMNGTFDPKEIESLAPKKTVVYAAVLGGFDRTAADRVVCHRTENRPVLALARDPRHTEALERLGWILDTQGVPFVIYGKDPADLLWSKNICVAVIGLLGILLKKPNGEIARDNAGREMASLAFQEALMILRAQGRRFSLPGPTPEESFLSVMAETGGNRVSMLQDAVAGRRTEMDNIVKPLLMAAKRRRIATPVLNNLYSLARFYLKNR